MNLFDELLLLLGLEAVVPLGEAGFACPILDQDELDRHPGDLVGRGEEVAEAGGGGPHVPGGGDDRGDGDDGCFEVDKFTPHQRAAEHYTP